MSPWQRNKAREIAAAYLQGEMLPLETALELYSHLSDDLPGDLQEVLLSITFVVSETDAIYLGERRQLWHPDVKAKEDRKHDEAQTRFAPIVRDACEQLVKLL